MVFLLRTFSQNGTRQTWGIRFIVCLQTQIRTLEKFVLIMVIYGYLKEIIHLVYLDTIYVWAYAWGKGLETEVARLFGHLLCFSAARWL